MGPIAYGLCAITSIVCLGLLLRSYLANRIRLLLWSSICFFCLSLQNIILFVDLVLTGPAVDLSVARTVVGFIGLLTLLVGLILESK